jgi:hypothetical protein
MSTTHWNRLLLAGLGAAVLLACLGAVVASVWLALGFLGGRRGAERAEQGGAEAPAVALAPRTPVAQWGFQDLQDHLADAGLRTSRGTGSYHGRSGMWFSEGDGAPLSAVDLAELNGGGGSWRMKHLGDFFVVQLASPPAAQAEAARSADVEQITALPCGRYLVFADANTLERLRGLLPH